MYWKYCVGRILNGIVIYAILIFIFSTLFNATMEQTLTARIEEEVRAEMLPGSVLSGEQLMLLLLILAGPL